MTMLVLMTLNSILILNQPLQASCMLMVLLVNYDGEKKTHINGLLNKDLFIGVLKDFLKALLKIPLFLFVIFL